MSFTVIHGDCLTELRKLPDASFDAMLTDPPAGIAFMNKDWDRNKGGRDKWIAWLAEIMREALRCLKPGARCLVWSLPRTQHWTMTALEDAGFEITDTVDHIFASGFPKSASVSLLLDRAAGVEREVVGERVLTGNAALSTKDKGGTYGVQVGTIPPKTVPVTAPATELAKAWDGHGTALKPAKEVWILCRKPLDGTIAHNVTEHGCGGLNIDGGRIEGVEWTQEEWSAKGASRTAPNAYSSAQKPTNRMLPPGRWPANVVFSHHEDCVRVGTKKVRGAAPIGPNPGAVRSVAHGYMAARKNATDYVDDDGNETVESWECVGGCPIRLLDEQSGDRPGMSGGGNHRADYAGGMFGAIDCSHTARGDSGGASRFFFCAKPSSGERNFGCEHLPLHTAGDVTDREDGSDGLDSPRAGAGRGGGARNFHPTIKGVSLTKYLATLLLPPARSTPRRILTPFCGSGGEMIGAMRAGWDEGVGIEQDEDFVTIARARLERWSQVSMSMDEADVCASAQKPDERQVDMWSVK